MALNLATTLILGFCLTLSANAFKATISLCVCTGDQPGTHCGFIEGILDDQHVFTYTIENNEEYRVPIAHLSTYQSGLCYGGTASKRWLIHSHHDLGSLGHVDIDVDKTSHGLEGHVDVSAHAGLVDGGVKATIDKDGVKSGSVHASTHVDGVEVGGHVGVDSKGTVSGGASVGLGAGKYGGVDIHAEGNSKGESSGGVGAHVDVGPLHGSATTDIHQDGKITSGADGHVDHDLGTLVGKKRSAK